MASTAASWRSTARRLAAQCGPWARSLPRLVAEDSHRRAERAQLDCTLPSPSSVSPTMSATDYLSAELLALRGWAGIVRQIEERPDRVPARDLTVTLRGYLAVRLLFERAALDACCPATLLRRAAVGPARVACASRLPGRPAPHGARARVAALSCGAALRPRCVDCGAVDRVGTWRKLESELQELDGVLASGGSCTRRSSERFVIACTTRSCVTRRASLPRPPAFQAVFCLDEREESIPPPSGGSRAGVRDLQHGGILQRGDVSPGRIRRASAAALPCRDPSRSLRGRNRDRTRDRLAGRSRRLQRRAAGFLGYNVHLGSRLPVRGAVLMTAFGWLALVPLVLRVVFPWLSSRWSHVQRDVDRRVANSPAAGSGGRQRRPSERIPGSPCGRWRTSCAACSKTSESAIVCARSCARPRTRIHQSQQPSRIGPRLRCVRRRTRWAQCARLRADGERPARATASGGRRAVASPPTTWFVGAQRNTCNNAVDVLRRGSRSCATADLFRAGQRGDRNGEAARGARTLPAVRRASRAGIRRWRRSPTCEGRAADLAQPRPEYGHATNAFCIVGRRTRTRGLFLDRRAFLVSYDPTQDDDGAILARIMAAVVPVVAGISLEYYFSYVDPIRLRLRHQTAAQRDVAARRDGRRAKRSANGPSLADGRDPRAHAARDRRGRHAGTRVGASCVTIRRSNGSCEIAGSGSPASTRNRAPCGSSGPPASSRTRPNMRLPSSSASRPPGIRANAAFFHRCRSCQRHSRADDARRSGIIGMMANLPLAAAGARRRRIAGDSVRAAWRHVAPQPAVAGAMDRPARGRLDDDRVRRLVCGVRRLRRRPGRARDSSPTAHGPRLTKAASRSSSSSIGSRWRLPRSRQPSPASSRRFRIDICTGSPATTATSSCWRCS